MYSKVEVIGLCTSVYGDDNTCVHVSKAERLYIFDGYSF